MAKTDPEIIACTAVPVIAECFNPAAKLPHGVTTDHIRRAMADFIDFLTFINTQLRTKQIQRMESFLMPANFSSIVGEFMSATIPKHCPTIVKNAYHNGHPDLIPKGVFKDDCCQHGSQGIEVKGSRYLDSWQGHNAEDTFLMVFVFESGRPTDTAKNVAPIPFRFIKVVAANLVKADWKFAGRSATSRRTITASVTQSGYAKMEANWIYRDTKTGCPQA